MHRHKDPYSLAPAHKGASVAMGNFDGVHRGHRTVIDLALAHGGGAPLGIVTFEPHPRSFFAAGAPPFRLMNADTRAHRLEKIGVQELYEIPFDATLSSLSAEEFVDRVLVEALGIAHVVVGADFCFGKGRSGTAQMLAEMGAARGFGVTIAPLVTEDAQAISSTAIRKALTDGRPEDAAAMLGHWHRIDGPVIHGAKRGRDLGFPTANLAVEDLHLPRFGVYAVLFDVLDGPHKGSYQGAASIGSRPMFGENRPNLETYVLDFKGDLYGAEVSVALVSFERPEMKFDSLDALVAQMKRDVDACRTSLAPHFGRP
ncbi:bifunctional riboflavin kinase/FAD synthetase [Algicella marina]|uniref:Riboflavin biosynthesis protein n=1 Tax=Algicella marina TaxID=2683284 RepID=A0A6P1T1N3_9RHOB|nr:bifunctional riboflavin kinase/FAD synthetase [Algicella marina]QHQ35897.1 bifunctional riboflavin kinase/FAD synthetase [Algicella marina]